MVEEIPLPRARSVLSLPFNEGLAHPTSRPSALTQPYTSRLRHDFRGIQALGGLGAPTPVPLAPAVQGGESQNTCAWITHPVKDKSLDERSHVRMGKEKEPSWEGPNS